MEVDCILIRCHHFIIATDSQAVLFDNILSQYRPLIAVLPIQPVVPPLHSTTWAK